GGHIRRADREQQPRSDEKPDAEDPPRDREPSASSIEPWPGEQWQQKQQAERDQVAASACIEAVPDIEDRARQEAAAEEVRGRWLAVERGGHRRDIEVPRRIAAERPALRNPIRRNRRRCRMDS